MAFLFDTDVLIDYLRNVPEAVEAVESKIEDAFISAMTVGELYQGVREGQERTKLARTLSAFTILSITEDVAEQGGLFSRDYRKTHGCGLADCLIAATAEVHLLKLETLNLKHYPMLKNVEAPYTKSSK